MLSDFLVSCIRTLVPAAAGIALAWLAEHLGVIDPGPAAVEWLTVAAVAAYYAAVRALEARWPAFGWLLGWGKAPEYPKLHARSR